MLPPLCCLLSTVQFFFFSVMFSPLVCPATPSPTSHPSIPPQLTLPLCDLLHQNLYSLTPQLVQGYRTQNRKL
ncbi:hypothetical protein J3E68DRAFT_386587 [Trichoderma sp. SZMC 28012]